jgi:hypothetical protein
VIVAVAGVQTVVTPPRREASPESDRPTGFHGTVEAAAAKRWLAVTTGAYPLSPSGRG